ncbi:MAG: helix-turn-helix domain-containing protein [Oscillospiraceae bacterium]|nr:helix-turn-helix domain-containing protein [Oscillospiraceae bacterium]
MDVKSIGASIASLRKNCGLTQKELAARLNISDKTVSRWESGMGYPEVTQFPALAKEFGVTVDYLMTGERKGITIAGNILTDIVKNITCYPEIGMLSSITGISQAVGGCAPNTAIDLAKIDRGLPLSVLGRVGADEYGRYVMAEMSRYGIDCGRIVTSPSLPTSFSDVMSLPSGERTFFHARGANAEFSPADIDISSLGCSILHIGYILLLDAFDKEDEEYGTVMARFLHDVQQHGIKTSIDVVSESTGAYKRKILPALKYCDYAVINEIEACMLSDLPPHDENGKVIVENIRRTMELMAEHGVREKVIIHCKEAGFCLDVPTGSFTAVPSLRIPPEEIKGSVGAGDAFCAGALYSIYNGYDDEKLLRFASSAAASNLFAENSVDGMLPREEIEKLEEKYGRRTL